MYLRLDALARGEHLSVQAQLLAYRDLDVPVRARDAGQLQIGVVAEGDRHRHVARARHQRGDRQPRPRQRRLKRSSCANGKAARSASGRRSPSGRKEGASASAAGARAASRGEAHSRPWIGSPVGSRRRGGARVHPASRPATGSACRPGGWPTDTAAGCPSWTGRRRRRRSPRRCPSSSSPRWRSEHPTIPAPATNVASSRRPRPTRG